MNIRRLEIAGSPAQSAVCVESLRPGLNVLTGKLGSLNSALADCIAHLLYGRNVPTSNRTAGSVDIETDLGNFRLRREPEKQSEWRLTISSLGSEPAAADTVSRVLGGCSSQFLTSLCFLDGNLPPQIDWLLSENVANNVNRLCGFRKKSFGEQSRYIPDLEEVDNRIELCNEKLHELEQRESQARAELTHLEPIESTAGLPLADLRAVLAVTERLVGELQSEIARFARNSSDICVCRDAYPRFLNLASLLEQQFSRLTSLNGVHERAIRYQELQSEVLQLARSQADLRDQLGRLSYRGDHAHFRSSDCLSRLTNGRLVKLKLVSGGRRACVVDDRGQTLPAESLPRADQQLVVISLQLAIISGIRDAGLSLPLILDEPFAFLDDHQAAILAEVLCDFAGPQVLVFTHRQAALEQFRAWGATIHDIWLQDDETFRPIQKTQRRGRTKQNRQQGPSSQSKPTALRIKEVPPEKPQRKKSRTKTRGQSQTKSAAPGKPRFCLELQSPIELVRLNPPEIASLLKANGVRHVRDLLAADVSKLANQLAVNGVSEVEIVSWQHQARLCCRIPGLQPIEAALLVGAGFSFPEDIGTMKPAELHEFIQSFGHMKSGRELLGNVSAPDLSRIESWIRAARQARVLGAA